MKLEESCTSEGPCEKTKNQRDIHLCGKQNARIFKRQLDHIVQNEENRMNK